MPSVVTAGYRPATLAYLPGQGLCRPAVVMPCCVCMNLGGLEGSVGPHPPCRPAFTATFGDKGHLRGESRGFWTNVTPSGAAGKVRGQGECPLASGSRPGRGSSHGAQLYFLFLNKPKPSVFFFTGTGSSAQTQGKDAFLEARAFLGHLRHLTWTHERVPSGCVCPAFSGKLSPPHLPPAHPEAALALSFSAIPLSPGPGTLQTSCLHQEGLAPLVAWLQGPWARGCVCVCLILMLATNFYIPILYLFLDCYMIEH